jgi:hypothetical protein
MSILLRAAVLGGIAYFITRSMRGAAGARRATAYGGGRHSTPLGELHPGESHVWPTSESQRQEPASAGPTS